MSKAIIITLERKVERQLNAAHMKLHLEALGIDTEILPATDYQTPAYRKINIAASGDQPIPLTPGEVACAWSHIRACHRVVELGEPAFVIEDDCLLLRDLSEVNTDPHYHFLSLSHWDPKDPASNKFLTTREYPNYVATEGLPYGTQVYYITPEAANNFVAYADPVRWPSDVALRQASVQGIIPTHLARQPAGIQHPFIKSHIGRR